METVKSHKFFFGIAIIGIIILAVFSYLSKNALISNENAAENLKVFNNYYNYLSKGNLLLFVILLFVSNIMYLNGKYWDTFVWTGIIFLGFNIVDWFWLSDIYFHYKKSNQLWHGETDLSYIVGFFFTFLGFMLIILNLGILKIIVNRKTKIKNKSGLKTPNTSENENEIRTNK